MASMRAFKNWRNQLLATAAVMTLAGLLGGCDDANQAGDIFGNYLNLRNSLLDPSQVGRFDKASPFRTDSKPVIWPILDRLDIEDQPSDRWQTATDPLPSDVVVAVEEYKVGEGDLLRVSVFELVTPGLEYFKETQVNELGDITIQNIQSVHVSGLTPTQIEDKIGQMSVDKGLLLPKGNGSPGPQVSVTLLQSRARVFSILGQAGGPGTYNIIGSDFRLLDALALSHDIPGGTQAGMDYLYVIRPAQGAGVIPADTQPAHTAGPTTNPMGALDSIEKGPSTAPATKPGAQLPTKATPLAVEEIKPVRKVTLADLQNVGATSVMSLEDIKQVQLAQADMDAALGGGATKPSSAPAAAASADTMPAGAMPAGTMPVAAMPAGTMSAGTMPAKPGDDLGNALGNGSKFGWVDGKWVEITGAGNGGLSPEESVAAATGLTNPRIIRIPINQLKEGNPKYNIVIRPGDIINIPNIEPGEFYMMGHVGGGGVYSLTGRKVTLKQAIAAARGLDSVAIPRRCDLIRRLGTNREVTIQVDLQKIFDGEQSDIFLKPNDVINVGTDAIAPFLAVTRNAYRASYGWGFVYDRNLYNQPVVTQNK